MAVAFNSHLHDLQNMIILSTNRKVSVSQKHKFHIILKRDKSKHLAYHNHLYILLGYKNMYYSILEYSRSEIK